jgi:nucleolar MIF4G domain-containing protein 1
MDDKFLKLAKKMGMNTEVRKKIFHILVTSEDYAEAFERFAKLGLKEKQEREIVRVIIHCCGQVPFSSSFFFFVVFCFL